MKDPHGQKKIGVFTYYMKPEDQTHVSNRKHKIGLR